jgi:histone acetyltransferase (RNA polymerase elongator complex component)
LLGEYNVKTVEIGAVSTSEEVLKAARRGYSRSRVIFAVNLVRDMGFEAGVQFVTGLPGDTLQCFLKTLSDVLSIGPRYAVLYPLVVLTGTELARLFRSKMFHPPGRTHILKTASLFIISCKMWNVKIARIGLYDSDIDPNHILYDCFPGNLRQEAEGVLCRLMVEHLISGNDSITSVNFNKRSETSVRGKNGVNLEKIFSANPRLRGQVFFHDHASLLVGVDRFGTEYAVSGAESEFLAFATGKIMERHTI